MASELHVDTIKHSGGTSAITIASDGTFLPQKIPCALMYLSSDAGNAADSSWTKIPYNAEEFDTHGIADTSDNRFEFTSATAGIYFFSACLRITQAGILNRFILALRKNASTYLSQNEINIPDITGSMYPQFQTSTMVSVANGDYIDAAYYITSGSATGLSESRSSTSFYCYRISA